jgi:hypothetical protein
VRAEREGIALLKLYENQVKILGTFVHLIMNNLHVRLNFNLSEEKGRESNTTAKKKIMKLVKLQNLVAKGCKAWKI